MKKLIIILILIICSFTMGCSSTKKVDIFNNTKEVKKMSTELENLNATLAQLKEKSAELDQLIARSNNLEIDKTEEATSKKDKGKMITIGDTIGTDKIEVTINNIEFSGVILPRDTSGDYTYFSAEEGMVYIDIDIGIKNLQKEKVKLEDIMVVVADYDRQDNYSSYALADGSSGFETGDQDISLSPLEAMNIRFLIQCPQEVEEKGDALLLNFQIDEEKYQYTMR